MTLLEIETYVFDRILTEFSEDIKTEYPDIRFTTSDREPLEPTFPCVYVHLEKSPELGLDIYGDSINGMNATFTIEVSDNENQDRAKTVANEVVRIMKGMRFKINEFPTFQNGTSIYRSIGRYRRIIGANDTQL